ncbi:MAG: sulfotransferase [Myxococcota bacterium]
MSNPSSDPFRREFGALVPFGWRDFGRKLRLLLEREGPGAAARQAAFRMGLLALSQVTWAADEVLAPEWREADGRGPLFVLGHQRSGTTLLHRLLASDVDHARALTLQEMLLPAVSAQRVVARVARVDRSTGRALERSFRAAQDRLFGPLDDIHRARFDEVEEDEFVLWAVYASAMCANDAPASTGERTLDGLRDFDAWSEDRRAEVLAWYRAVLRKKLFREPGGDAEAWIVAKNPAFTRKIPALLRAFPDARFVYLVRDPREAIPSRLSLVRAIWRRRFPGFREMRPEQVETLLADSVRTYLRAERDLPQVPTSRRLVVTYDDLVASPADVVRRIYARFALPGPGRVLEARLDDLEGRPPRPSRHRYGLEEFGLDPDRVTEPLAVVLERYGFDTA